MKQIAAIPATLLVACIGALGGLLFGYDTGVIAGALQFIQQDYHLTTGLQEILVSSVVLGATLGAIVSGRLADRYGRRYMLLNAAIAFILGTAFTSFGNNIASLTAGRLIAGFAIGISSYTAPLYISEMAPTRLRGSLVMINAITITGGEAIAFLIDYYLTPSAAWRMMFAVGFIPAILLFIGMCLLPETPRWLLLQGQLEKAKKIMQQLFDKQQIERMKQAIEQSQQTETKPDWRQLFSAKIRRVLFIGIMLGLFQQFFGINTVMYYGPTIFAATGFKSAQSEILATFAFGCVNTVMSFVCMLVIDKLGRRKLLLTGSALAAVSLAVVASSLQFPTTALSKWLAFSALISFVAGYCLSVGSLFWLMIAEIFPLSIRGFGMSLAASVQWAANFVVSMTFLSLIHYLGAADTFWLYTSICGACFVYCYWQVPETKGVSLELIEKNLAEDKPNRELGLPIKPLIQDS